MQDNQDNQDIQFTNHEVLGTGSNSTDQIQEGTNVQLEELQLDNSTNQTEEETNVQHSNNQQHSDNQQRRPIIEDENQVNQSSKKTFNTIAIAAVAMIVLAASTIILCTKKGIDTNSLTKLVKNIANKITNVINNIIGKSVKNISK
ncbi:hypothetical protein [Lyticum sinuosum]|uniref:Uncharacterized protein n=1 Tax=Lyticum sinuosum TaxID=1332059 RepID=A0AAE4VL36_9RICK|nr:hypothetical protein [Lyticum sinuosum]MDZ5761122.1 hypothetical protein [Lyticum sinuosum]